jgi:hypothetical protein
MIVSNPSHRIVTTIIVPMTAAKALILTPAVVFRKCLPKLLHYLHIHHNNVGRGISLVKERDVGGYEYKELRGENVYIYV